MILGVQYCEADFDRSMKLAMLLADLEPSFRSNAILALVRDSSFTPDESRVKIVVEHCSSKFAVELVVLPQSDSGWPRGPNQQWLGMMEHFAVKARSGDPRYSSIFVFDGGDGVPLRKNWIDLLMIEHERTLQQGKLITGTIGIDNTNRFHINGNLVLETRIWDLLPELHTCPDHDSWDCYHFPTFTPHTSLSTIIRNDWRYQGEPTTEHLAALSLSSVWWHGCKSEILHDMTRSLLLDHPVPQPPLELKRWSTFTDYTERPLRRHKPWVNGHSVSLTVGCMNRRSFLERSLSTWVRSAVPSEIVIVDWSSSESLQDLVKLDPRIIVVRVTDQRFWHNSKCHNLEFRLARGGIVLRMDSDYLLGDQFFPKHPLVSDSFYAGNWRLELNTDKKSLSGIVYVHRSDLFKVNGYNERLNGYGQEEDDLYDRLSDLGLLRNDVDLATLEHIPHSDELRYKNLRVAADLPRLFREGTGEMSPHTRSIINSERLFLIELSKRKIRSQPWTMDDHMTRWLVKPTAERYYECKELAFGAAPDDSLWTLIECNL